MSPHELSRANPYPVSGEADLESGLGLGLAGWRAERSIPRPPTWLALQHATLGGPRGEQMRWGERGLPDVFQQICLLLLPGLKAAELLQEAKLHLLGRLHLHGYPGWGPPKSPAPGSEKHLGPGSRRGGAGAGPNCFLRTGP